MFGGTVPFLYFEIDYLSPKTPLPFLNIKPAMRVGVCQIDVQDVNKPFGSNILSYAYSNTGKLIRDGKADGKRANDPYSKCHFYVFVIICFLNCLEVGDTISVLIFPG